MQRMPIIIAPSGFLISVIALPTVPLNYTLFSQSPWITSPSGASMKLPRSATTSWLITAKWKCASRYYSGVHEKSGNVRFITAAYTKLYEKNVSGVCGSSRHAKIFILAGFWTSDDHEMTKGLLSKVWNLRFTTVLDVQGAGNEERVAQTTCKIRISRQLDVRPPRNDERVARTTCNIPFRCR